MDVKDGAMTMRTVSRTVVFTHNFTLIGLDGVQPARTYSVETDEELLDGPSFPAWRRHATWMRFHPQPGTTLTATIDPVELDAALMKDRKRVESRLESPGRQAHRIDKKILFDNAAHGNPLSGNRFPPISRDHFPSDDE
jgi:hypothetical protein